MKKYMYSDYENRDEVFNTYWAIKEKLFGKVALNSNMQGGGVSQKKGKKRPSEYWGIH